MALPEVAAASGAPPPAATSRAKEAASAVPAPAQPTQDTKRRYEPGIGARGAFGRGEGAALCALSEAAFFLEIGQHSGLPLFVWASFVGFYIFFLLPCVFTKG